jgi:protein-S-isoprenylcysteine O-methyltransferase Ste14
VSGGAIADIRPEKSDFINLRNPVKLPQFVQAESSAPAAGGRPIAKTVTRLGGWLFRHRTALPLPIAAALLTLRIGEAPPSVALLVGGLVVSGLGEWLRLWGVRHIGAISRTRSDRLGPLVDTGPFARVRNPLYIGNVLLWVGLALTARLVWLAPAIVVLLGLEYHAIVRWEEQLLEGRRGDEYRDYCARVPRWMPSSIRSERRKRTEIGRSATAAAVTLARDRYSWRDTLFSERGTLIAMAVGYVLIWIKLRR